MNSVSFWFWNKFFLLEKSIHIINMTKASTQRSKCSLKWSRIKEIIESIENTSNFLTLWIFCFYGPTVRVFYIEEKRKKHQNTNHSTRIQCWEMCKQSEWANVNGIIRERRREKENISIIRHKPSFIKYCIVYQCVWTVIHYCIEWFFC